MQIQFHHEGHEVNEVKPGSAGRRTGFMHFAFGDQRLAVGSRPAGRRWRVKGNNFLFAGETLTVQGSPLHPSSRTLLTDSCEDNEEIQKNIYHRAHGEHGGKTNTP